MRNTTSDDQRSDDSSRVFEELLTSSHFVWELLDAYPIPIEVFAPNGIAIYANSTALRMVGVTDASLVIGTYNLHKDPVCLEILGQDSIDKIFRGEPCVFYDFPAPIQDLYVRGVVDEKPWEAATMDMHLHPIWEDDTFVCTVCYFIVKNIYLVRSDLAKAQEYLDRHWLDDFDIDKVAKSANLSVHHFQRVFKHHVGVSPYDYYRNIKINRIKEKLRTTDLSITQVFMDCGIDSKGSYFRYFKQLTKMTPSQYRKQFND